MWTIILLRQYLHLRSTKLLHSHLPVGLYLNRDRAREAKCYSRSLVHSPHIPLLSICYEASHFSKIQHTHWDPGHKHILGWLMWEKYSHLVQQGYGEKVLLPFAAASLSDCLLKQHSPTASLGLPSTHPWVSQAAGIPVRLACHFGHSLGCERSCGSLQRMSEVEI